MNVAAPLESVVVLVGDTDMRFLPAALIVAVTVSPSTAQSSSPVTVTVTSPLFFLLRLSVVLDTATFSASHTVGGVGDTIGDGGGGNVGGNVGDPIGDGGGGNVGGNVGVVTGVAVGDVTGVAVGDAPGVGDVTGVGVATAAATVAVSVTVLEDPVVLTSSM